jgi:hypothetical protein
MQTMLSISFSRILRGNSARFPPNFSIDAKRNTLVEHIRVRLEHHIKKHYHAIKYGPGRRSAAGTYGKFNLRHRDPQLGGKRVRVTLDVSGLTAALEARGKKPTILAR